MLLSLLPLLLLLPPALSVSSSLMALEDFICEESEAGQMRLVKELESATSGFNIDVAAKEGRLEVCLTSATLNGTYYWGTVCDDNFDSFSDAYYICKSFAKASYGYEFADGTAYGRVDNTLYKTGLAEQPYFLDEMGCSPDEIISGVGNWWDCDYSGKDSETKINVTKVGSDTSEIVTIGAPATNCNHKEDVFITCKEVLECYTCSGTSYDDCSANEMTQKECSKTEYACYRKVEVTQAGELSVSHGCMTEKNCDSWDVTCAANEENYYCYCNSCTSTRCNSLFQIMMEDFGDFAVEFGKLVEWMISKFTLIMRIVLFDLTAYGI